MIRKIPATFILVLAILITSCSVERKPPRTGFWRATLEVQDDKYLPFIFELDEGQNIILHNGEERILVEDIDIKEDSIIIAHPVFEGVFKGVYSEKEIHGDFIKPSLDRVVPFRMIFGESVRFPETASPEADVSGEWEMIFSAHSEEDRYIAKGIFNQEENGTVRGTIRTTTGDYRYLEGVMDGKLMRLSTFDGAHAFLFEAEVKDSLLYGFFYSGNHWKEPFSGILNPDYELPNANSLTYLKKGYDRFDFSFPDVTGDTISLSDERFQNKVVVVQIMGTWCPNCLEESEYYVEYIENNPSPDLEFVSLAFEYAPTREKAIQGINKLTTALDIPYPILIAQYGSSSKQKAADKLPMLNHVLSYPTTVFIDKQGVVRKIHTGFNGKATGAKYRAFKDEFESFVDTLLKE